jgi:diguanylate cyclase (GGDEF)-like protein
MLDQQTGARGYFETGESAFLAPWYEGRRQFASALRQARDLLAGDPSSQQLLAEQAQLSGSWDATVQADIDRLRETGRRPSLAADGAEKSLMDEFRQANGLFETQLASRRNSSLSQATWLAVAVAALVSILLVLAAILLVRRVTRREARRQSGLQELREMLQVSASEQESQLLLIHHVERTVPGAAAAVLTRNNSDDRLEPRLSENVEQTPLRGLEVDQLKPRSCMAVRLSRSYVQRRDDDPLVRCEVCGRIGADVVCEPLLVGGRVIGSVLVTRDRSIDADLRAHVQDSVVQAAPILANQRNLALAERRAASDALTGLPNRRAADETLKRMAAHAGRTVTPLSVVLVDLDHFKQVNDLHGHELGDKALAAVGQIFSGSLRASDFAARYGGEEFLLLLPDTNRGGALAVAEKLRRAVQRAEIRDVGPITASFGVATLPDDSAEPEDLVRRADRALYAAKANGRNRVEVAAAADPEVSGRAE